MQNGVFFSWIRLLLSLVLGLGAICLLAANLHAQGITVKPMLIDISLAPGETHTEVIEIGNTAEEDLRVMISKADFTITEGGGIDLLEAGASPSSLADRFSLSTEELVVKAGEIGRVSLSFVFPEDAPAAPLWGCLIVETAEPIGTMGTGDTSIGVRVKFLVLIFQRDSRIVQKEGHVTAMKVEIIEPEEGDSRTVAVATTFNNTCLDILKTDILFEIRDMTGATIATDEIKDRRVLPGYKRSFTKRFPAEEWQSGQYIALAIIDYGGETLAGGQWGFEVPEEE